MAFSHGTWTLHSRAPICPGLICDIIKSIGHTLRQTTQQRHFVSEPQKEGNTQDVLSLRWNSSWELEILVSELQGCFCPFALGVSYYRPDFLHSISIWVHWTTCLRDTWRRVEWEELRRGGSVPSLPNSSCWNIGQNSCHVCLSYSTNISDFFYQQSKPLRPIFYT